jgi:hypothetical protein
MIYTTAVTPAAHLTVPCQPVPFRFNTCQQARPVTTIPSYVNSKPVCTVCRILLQQLVGRNDSAQHKLLQLTTSAPLRTVLLGPARTLGEKKLVTILLTARGRHLRLLPLAFATCTSSNRLHLHRHSQGIHGAQSSYSYVVKYRPTSKGILGTGKNKCYMEDRAALFQTHFQAVFSRVRSDIVYWYTFGVVVHYWVE